MSKPEAMSIKLLLLHPRRKASSAHLNVDEFIDTDNWLVLLLMTKEKEHTVPSTKFIKTHNNRANPFFFLFFWLFA